MHFDFRVFNFIPLFSIRPLFSIQRLARFRQICREKFKIITDNVDGSVIGEKNSRIRREYFRKVSDKGKK